jgi:hypothetical protein
MNGHAYLQIGRQRMTEAKTKPRDAAVASFIDSLPDGQRADAGALVELMRRATHLEPMMWGSAIVGFGSVHYVHDSGREGDTCLLGFSPRKKQVSIYLPGGHAAYAEELARLGKHDLGKGCLYIKRLADVDVKVLSAIFTKALKVAAARQR